MTVKELIEQLKKIPDHYSVWVQVDDFADSFSLTLDVSAFKTFPSHSLKRIFIQC